MEDRILETTPARDSEGVAEVLGVSRQELDEYEAPEGYLWNRRSGSPRGGLGEKSPDVETPGVKRVNVNFAPSAYAELQALAEAKGKTLSEVLREAIILSRWFHNVTHQDGTHLLIERDGKTREIVPIL